MQERIEHKYTCMVELPQKCSFSKELTRSVCKEYELNNPFPPFYGICVAEKDDIDGLQSLIIADKDLSVGTGQTQLEQLLAKDCLKIHTEEVFTRDGFQIARTLYYLMYQDKKALCFKPDVSEEINYCVNTESDIKLEVRFLQNDGYYSRHLYFDFRSKGLYGMSLFDMMHRLPDMLETAIEKGEMLGCRKKNSECGDDYYQLCMFNEFGDSYWIDFESIEMMMLAVTNVRMVENKVELVDIVDQI